MSLILPTTPEGLPLPFLQHDTEDPAELARLVADWEKTHGRYTHVLFQCEPGILFAPRPATSVLIPRDQPVFTTPAEIDRARVHPVTLEMVRTSLVRAEAPSFFSWCLVPLVCVTHVPADRWRGVPARKVGVNTFLTGEALLQAMDAIPDPAPPDPQEDSPAPHAYQVSLTRRPGRCDLCGRPVEDPVHRDAPAGEEGSGYG